MLTLSAAPTVGAQDDAGSSGNSVEPGVSGSDSEFASRGAFPAWSQAATAPIVPEARGIGVNPNNGEILVVSEALDHVDVLDAAGQTQGAILGSVGAPQGLLVHNDELWVTDMALDQVSVWTLDGGFKRSFGATGD
ncbi:MAG: hypothetical protein OEW42_14770 [Acidimicrobiia bacterium]|nr:hypothetical protein [Acidimicrobiia bacterium]